MTGIKRVPRTRGFVSGLLLVLLGVWGGLLPLAGPSFDFGFAPDDAWYVDADRFLFSVLPAIAVVLGGLIVLAGANRVIATFGGWLAALGGAWFALGGTIASLWDAGPGAPLGTSEGQRVAETLLGFTALGTVIVFLSAFALGRFAVVGVREVRHDRERDAEEQAAAERDDVFARGAAEPQAQGRYAREGQHGPPQQRQAHADEPVAGERRHER
ncbi:hypothetical protein [Spirillospora albida]|uniref:hypothetical protein n=1 Tax=Spirillospora albida TaxID=58123 RepID=UPI0012F84B5F|nr:hypothetical protein [Spirillospora albida]